MTERTWERPDTASLDLPEVMALILDRCPWAGAHTHASLQKFLLEETYELLGALDTYEADPTDAHAEEVLGELGDVLYQVLFHAALIDPEHGFEMVSRTLKAKLVRRHPHVFDSTGPVPIDEVERRYEAVKAAERAAKADVAGAADGTEAVSGAGAGSVAEAPAGESSRVARVRASFDSVPTAMPALARAHAVFDRIERLELPVPEAGQASPEVPAQPGTGDGDPGTGDAVAEAEGRLGRGILALVQEAREAGVDAEAALRRATAELEAAVVNTARSESEKEQR